MIAVSKNIHFGAVEELPSHTKDKLLDAVKNVVKQCRHAGFRVNMMLMDGEFEPLRGDLADKQIALNTTSHDEHVGDIEQCTCTAKERIRAISAPRATATSDFQG